MAGSSFKPSFVTVVRFIDSIAQQSAAATGFREVQWSAFIPFQSTNEGFQGCFEHFQDLSHLRPKLDGSFIASAEFLAVVKSIQ